MKQIIVNVDSLTIEDKQRIAETLTKIKNISMCNPMHWDVVDTLYGPSREGANVGFSYNKSESPTHTPQQVLAMASSFDQDIILADTLIITDSSGNIIYDSTLGALNHVIKRQADPSVKLDKNGAAVMVEKRKVRKDFNAGKEYSVNVEGCTEDVKKEVQQAFFDAGFPWRLGGKEYRCLDAVQYSNALVGRGVTAHLLYSDTTTKECNMTAQEFLELVYEPEQVGHVHAELMAQYAEDAKSHAEPWELWEYLDRDDGWVAFRWSPGWYETTEYRRKPKTHTVNGVEIPDLRIKPEEGDYYYMANPTSRSLFTSHKFGGDRYDKVWLERGLCYEPTEEGKQAAILHSKAMLGLVKE